MFRRKRAAERQHDEDSTAEENSPSAEELLIERLRELDLPQPPPGTKERGLERFQQYLDEHPELSSPDGTEEE